MELTGKEKRYLRSLGNRLETHVTLGHSGLTDSVWTTIDEQLKKNELIKVRLNKAFAMERKEAAQLISEKSDSAIVKIFGSTVLFYRKNEDNQIIKFPKAGLATMKPFFDDDDF